ncbi:MAG: hypothetical protein AAB308_09750 [Nitrospirota bacterium]
MSDYLSQLALRIQQPEMTVQPRPVSRFESQRHSIRTTLESPAQEEADERGPQSAVFIPDETIGGRLTQSAESPIRKESDRFDFLSEVQPTKKSHKSYPGQSTVVPVVVPPANSTEIIDSSVLEVAHPTSPRPQAEQSTRIVRSAVAQAQPSGGIDRLEQQTSKDSSNPLGRRERSEFTDLVTHRENGWRPSIVRIENPQGVTGSSLVTQALKHRERGRFSELTDTKPVFGRKTEVTTKSGMVPVPRREHPQPRGEAADAQFGMARATDAPTIQVTIGRVEIRATVAQTPTRKTPTHRPAMSLDEYLKQRNGSRG